MTSPILSRITVYPIKSLDGVSVESTECLDNGALLFDRRFAICTAGGQILSGKRSTAFHRLQASFDLEARTVTLGIRAAGVSESFSLEQPEQLNRYLSDFFDQSVRLVEDMTTGFPDDTEAGGPTLIGEATLECIAGWFDESVDEMRRRFRTNLEVAGVEPFWEDRLYSEDGGVEFQIGTTTLLGTNACQRCAVPTRSADTGDVTAGFVKEFSRQRERTLPDWAPVNRFDHFYRVAINTIGTDIAGSILQTGTGISVRDRNF